MPALRRIWPFLAVIAGGLLIFFEYSKGHGITGDNAFWLLIGAVVVLMGLLEVFRVGHDTPREPPEPPLPPLSPD